MSVYDLVVRRARLVDGSGGAPELGSLAVSNGRIAAVFRGEDGENARASVEVDGLGKVLCPGFIDVHSHDDFAALHTPLLPFKTLQGVTCEVVGNCGIGAAPFPGAEDWYEKLHPDLPLPSFVDFAGYFQRLEEEPPALNLAVLAGHGALRRAGAPGALRKLSSPELGRVEQALDEALDAGAIGLSAGLIYEPGLFADEEELKVLARRAASRSGLFTVHLRSEADDLLPAVSEAIRIAGEAGVRLQLSHHKAHGRNNWGKVKGSLALVDEARAQGLDVWIDQYPYAAGSTILKAVIDRGGLSGGPGLGVLLPSDIVIANCPSERSWEGKSLQELAEIFRTDPERAAERVLSCEPGAWVVVHAMSPDDVEEVMRHPATLFGSDGLPTSGGRPHPRLWGTFPRILGHYVRDRRVLSLEAAIAKMTGQAAARFGLLDRGVLRVGAWADLVLFDPARVDAQATYEEPLLPPIGIERVWVNGVCVASEGQTTGARPGKMLRRVS